MNRTLGVFSSESGRERWNAFVRNSSMGHLMQTCEWGDFKAALGWTVHRIAIEREGELVAGAQMLLRPLPVLPLTVAYIPKGPIVDLGDGAIVEMLLSAIHQMARSQRAIMLKIEPNLLDDDRVHDLLTRCGFHHSVHTNQPRSTLIVDLSSGEHAVLANMRRKTRKLIRRATREGVEVVGGEGQDIDDFYRILEFTGEVKDFPIHDKAFYRQAWKAFWPSGSIHLLLAKYQRETVAGKMIFVFRDRSMHFWGGTSDSGRDMYASYLLQWEAIRWAMRRGCTHCDLWGIPDEIGDMVKRGQDVPKDGRGGLWGVYNFKRGFGGKVESYVGAYDYVYNPALYSVIQLFSRLSSVDTLSRLVEQFER